MQILRDISQYAASNSKRSRRQSELEKFWRVYAHRHEIVTEKRQSCSQLEETSDDRRKNTSVLCC